MAETLDFTRALTLLRQQTLAAEVVAQTLGCLLKDGRDLESVTGADSTSLVAQAQHDKNNDKNDKNDQSGGKVQV